MIFSPKDPSSQEFFGLDFIRQLAPGETIVSAVWSVTVKQGTDPSPSSMLSGAPVINGTKVSQMIVGGLDGVQYCLTCIATTSSSEQIPLSGTVWVRTCC